MISRIIVYTALNLLLYLIIIGVCSAVTDKTLIECQMIVPYVAYTALAGWWIPIVVMESVGLSILDDEDEAV